ncbi:MAG: glycerol-3-phosphate acyltransferase [Acidimicrobiales bacterium]
MNELGWLIAAVVSYLIGTFPSAQLVAGRAVTRQGSGNPGASNTMRIAGRRAGAAVLALDLAKGAVPTLIALMVSGRGLAALCWAAAVAGHVFPVTRRFRGGKGVATGAGGAIVLYPLIGLVLAPLFVVVTRLTGKASLGSLAIAVGLVAGVVVTGRPTWEVVVTTAIVVLVVARHAANIARLVRRREPSLR